jgi:(E)-4-hydroxy-3-methylbut-2-enyl-diphosphate synthase
MQNITDKHYMNYKRRKTVQVSLGHVKIGSKAPISVQSMTNTFTSNMDKTLLQINTLKNAGADIVRVAVATEKDAKALKNIVQNASVPIVADIHFRAKLAVKSIEQGVQGIRINPGNMPKKDIKEIVDAAKLNKVIIRVGANAGSISAENRKKYKNSPVNALVNSALENIKLIEKLKFNDLKVSLKHHDPMITVKAYEVLANKVDYPFHIGVTEAGATFSAIIKNTSAISILLNKGIGDTIRVSISGDKVKEIETANEILMCLGLKQREYEIISCPTCSRTQIDVIKMAELVEKAVKEHNIKLKIAVMGCIVNGPGEASDADIGIAGGKSFGTLFIKGKKIKQVKEQDIVPELIRLAKKLNSSSGGYLG